METAVNVILGLFSIWVIKTLIIDPEISLRKLQKKAEEEKKIAPVVEKKRNKAVSDFYGTDAMREHPEKFLRTVEEKRKKIEAGEEVGVDAAQAFYLIRNSRHHDLIVGENGVINLKKLTEENYSVSNDLIDEFKKAVDEFEMEGTGKKDLKPIPLPKHIERVEELGNGGTRWVYAKWHADECKIKGLCFDKHGRSMPDPDVQKEETKSKGKKGDSNSQRREDSEVTDLSKKVSRLVEMQEETRVDIMLNATKKIETENESLENSDSDLESEMEFEKIQAKNISASQILKPAEYKDEITTIEEEFPAPDFFSMLEPEISQDTISIEDEEDFVSGHLQFEYGSYERFIAFTAGNKEFVEAVFEKIFSKDGIGFVFANFTDREMYLEKNYFARAVRDLILQEDRKQFERDFLAKDAGEIFDGYKIGDVIQSMNDGRNIFLKYGRGGERTTYNLLFQTSERPEKFVQGWFAKMRFDSIGQIENFLNDFAEEVGVTLVAASPKEIESRRRLLKNVKTYY